MWYSVLSSYYHFQGGGSANSAAKPQSHAKAVAEMVDYGLPEKPHRHAGPPNAEMSLNLQLCAQYGLNLARSRTGPLKTGKLFLPLYFLTTLPLFILQIKVVGSLTKI